MTQTELSKYLQNKGPEELLDLHELPPKSNKTLVDDRLPDWVDPTLLSKTEAYQVSRYHRLPKELSSIIHNNGWIKKGSSSSNPKFRAHVENHFTLVTVTNTYICFYLEPKDSKYRFFTLDTAKLTVAGVTPPFVQVFDNLTTAAAISTSGSVYLWKDYTTSSDHIAYQIPLLSYYETITCIEFIDNEHILIGSSKGELYLLKIENNSLTTFSIFMHKFSMLDLFTHRRLPSLSDIEKSSFSMDPIVRIHYAVASHQLYVLTDKTIQYWSIEINGEVKLLSNHHIEDEVELNLLKLIPDHISSEGVQFDILNMSVYNNKEMVIIASYSVAGLGNYVQYALISFQLRHDQPPHVRYTASIPYSAIPSTLKYTPRLSVTSTLVFVTFDSTVIAVSAVKNSSFEESVVLNEDEVLCTTVEESEIATIATIYTLASGIMQFKINKESICASEEEGNIYAVIDDTEKRDELVFKSKLEQAVFFGARSEPLLQFFLRPEEQVDISKVVMGLSDKIYHGKCKYLPSINRTELYVEARYLFEKKIVSVLKENHFLSAISNENKVKLMKRTELYYLAQVLHRSSCVRDEIMKCWIDIIKNIVITKEADTLDRAPFAEFVVDHPSQIVEFIRSYVDCARWKEGDLDNQNDQIKMLENANTLLMRMMKKSRIFEEKYTLLYNVQVDSDFSIAGEFRDMLLDLFYNNIDYIQKHTTSDLMESDSIELIKKYVCEIGSLIVQSFQDYAKLKGDRLHNLYFQMRKEVIEGLCETGLYEKAIELAEQHNDIPAVVESVNKSPLSSEARKEKNIYFIDLFEKHYFDCLLSYLDSDNSGCDPELILDLCALYPAYAESFHQHNDLKVSWVYHLKGRRYEEAAKSIEKFLEKENLDESKRVELLGWKEMIDATVKSRADSISTKDSF